VHALTDAEYCNIITERKRKYDMSRVSVFHFEMFSDENKIATKDKML